MTTTDLSKLTPKEMAECINLSHGNRSKIFVKDIIQLMDAHIITSDYKYWNDVLENL